MVQNFLSRFYLQNCIQLLAACKFVLFSTVTLSRTLLYTPHVGKPLVPKFDCFFSVFCEGAYLICGKSVCKELSFLQHFITDANGVCVDKNFENPAAIWSNRGTIPVCSAALDTDDEDELVSGALFFREKNPPNQPLDSSSAWCTDCLLRIFFAARTN